MIAFQPVLQDRLPHVPNPLDLPGTRPIPADDWLRMDQAYAGQMAIRDVLIAQDRAAVLGAIPNAAAAQAEVLELVFGQVTQWPGFETHADHVRRPDGVEVRLDGDASPLVTAGRLVQQDLCIMQDLGGGEYGLAAALLCFPAGWTLAEKLGRPLGSIHDPVTEYTENMAKRVERLFRAVRVGQPLCRSNLLAYDSPDLFAPMREAAARAAPKVARYLRSERQTILRLPKTGAALFSIHTVMVATAWLDAEQYAQARQAVSSEIGFPARQVPGWSRP